MLENKNINTVAVLTIIVSIILIVLIILGLIFINKRNIRQMKEHENKTEMEVKEELEEDRIKDLFLDQEGVKKQMENLSKDLKIQN